MASNYSLSLICPVDDVAAADTFFKEAFGWGDTTFVSPASSDGQLPVTHKGAHDFQTEEFIAALEAAKASSDPTLDALNPVIIYSVESETPKYDDALAANGLQRYNPPMEL